MGKVKYRLTLRFRNRSVNFRLKRVVKGRHWVNFIDIESESGSINRHVNKKSSLKISRSIYRNRLFHCLDVSGYYLECKRHWQKKWKHIYKLLNNTL